PGFFSDPDEGNPFMPDEPHQEQGGTAQPEGSVALAIATYLQGDDSKLGEMIVAYRAELLAFARAKLRKAPHLRARTDDEGGVLSAMGRFWRAMQDGRYHGMKHRDELLRLLVGFVRHKVAHQIRDLSTEIAGRGQVLNEPPIGLDDGQRLGAPCQ